MALPSEPNAKTASAKTISFFSNSDEDDDNDESFEFKIDEDGEICVFSADKYFNGTLEPPRLPQDHPRIFRNCGLPPPPPPRHHHHHHSPMEKPPRSRPSTPSVRSESSGNSRTHLLLHKTPETHRLPPADNSGKLRRKSFLSAIGCNHCFCNGGSSVEIGESKNRGSNPNPNPEHLQIENSPVFSNPQSGTRMAAGWDDIDGDEDEYDEVGSEASSDLFEIESFPGGNPNPFDRPIGFPARTSSYAPSEASVEWSVATASAADFSAASDSEEPKVVSSSSSSSPSRRKGRSRTEKTKNPPKRITRGILIPTGCRSEKAVGVAGDAYRTTVTGGREVPAGGGRRKHQSSESPYLPPLNRVRGAGGGFGTGSFSAAISTRSQPHLLFI